MRFPTKGASKVSEYGAIDLWTSRLRAEHLPTAIITSDCEALESLCGSSNRLS